MDELKLAKLLGIACQATCGCGNGLIKYEGEASNTNFFLTCRPYSDKYDHPMKIIIPKDCQLIKDHDKLEKIEEYLTAQEKEPGCKICQNDDYHNIKKILKEKS